MYGWGREARTPDLSIPNAARCRLRYTPKYEHPIFYLAGGSKPHDYTWSNYHIANDFFCHNSIIPQGSRSTLSPYPVKKGVPNFQRVKTSLFLLTKQHFSAPNYVHYSRNSFGRDPNTGIVCICDIQAVSNGVLLV